MHSRAMGSARAMTSFVSGVDICNSICMVYIYHNCIYIITYEWLIFTANVRKYNIPYMDGMGRTTQIYTFYKFGWPITQEQSPVSPGLVVPPVAPGLQAPHPLCVTPNGGWVDHSRNVPRNYGSKNGKRHVIGMCHIQPRHSSIILDPELRLVGGLNPFEKY